MPHALKRFAVALTALPLMITPIAATAEPPAIPAKKLDESIVTLITGDRVQVTRGADGRRSAAPLPGPVSDPDGYLTSSFGTDVYVTPVRALPFLQAGRLDQRLFNVSALVDQGYDDAHTDRLPLIATEQLDGTTITTDLSRVSAVALSADKRTLTETWADFTGNTSRLWLDGKVEPQMVESNAQIGTPAAWAGGFDGTGATVAVLDTGWDTTHPDLAGKVIGSRNFTGSNPNLVTDNDGHGTHVASTIAGSGASSGGAEKGVAPGANLLIGKVLNPSGQDSWILAGMAWAVEQGADVVNMSLGGRIGGDCNDVFSVAAQQLTEQSGTLFVMSAGNAGPSQGTVGSPGCVPAALTVGAVDAAGATAAFSSRGPIATHGGIKPEIAAPGVDILAARRGGGYTGMSGTSMASPHVAGVAALLAARHGDWTAQQLKNALISSATPGAKDHVFAQGAGVVNAARAVSATVFGPGVVDAGSFAWPHEAQPRATTTVKLTNTGDIAKTLALSLDGFAGEDGLPLKHDTVALAAAEVTVPAHGTAERRGPGDGQLRRCRGPRPARDRGASPEPRR